MRRAEQIELGMFPYSRVLFDAPYIPDIPMAAPITSKDEGCIPQHVKS
jgi:hypothetical protein